MTRGRSEIRAKQESNVIFHIWNLINRQNQVFHKVFNKCGKLMDNLFFNQKFSTISPVKILLQQRFSSVKRINVIPVEKREKKFPKHHFFSFPYGKIKIWMWKKLRKTAKVVLRRKKRL